MFRLAPALLLGLVAVPAAAQTSGPAVTAVATSTAAHDTSKIRIDNFGRIDDHYFRGSQPEGHDYAALAAAGIKTIVNLESDDAQPNERSMVEAAGMHYVQIPMTTHVPPTATQVAEFLAVVHNAAAQPVYVHCVGGRHRTGVMTAVYRMTEDGWSGAQAFSEMKTFKFGADFLHSEFKNFVMAYPAQLAQHAAAATAAAATPKAGG